MIVLLMLLYPRLTSRSLVGTDLVQAVPLVAAAAVGQLRWGHVDFGLAGALLLGNNVHGLAWALLIVLATGLPLCAAVDATLRRTSDWSAAGYRRTTWVALLAIGAPLGIGLVVVVPYVLRVRPQVRRAEDRRRAAAPRDADPLRA